MPQPDPIPTFEGEEYEVERILNHERRGRRFQFLKLMKGFPTHDAEWQLTKDFIESDRTINEPFLSTLS